MMQDKDLIQARIISHQLAITRLTNRNEHLKEDVVSNNRQMLDNLSAIAGHWGAIDALQWVLSADEVTVQS